MSPQSWWVEIIIMNPLYRDDMGHDSFLPYSVDEALSKVKGEHLTLPFGVPVHF